ncbi:hypothetical protein M422DRAFT_270420 [Sphaerobolus stellatus SS14]|uniref:Protein kinase domain-containing protein n=1 Tax=Sphaerobolus stellatus (strain SS14) TaxID=990650 RepID=A0A0C9USE4_SPHS4|nr:hypothetical protein M422DRAFT_270420 [Sphaerobolus stellatus SS14]
MTTQEDHFNELEEADIEGGYFINLTSNERFCPSTKHGYCPAGTNYIQDFVQAGLFPRLERRKVFLTAKMVLFFEVDCTGVDIMMDTSNMFPNEFHPVDFLQRREGDGHNAQYYSRTAHSTKYYLINFGLSRHYDLAKGAPFKLKVPIIGADHTTPESQGDGARTRSNPYSTDVYYLGNWVKKDFMSVYINFDFMFDLVKDMTREDPSERPKMDEVMIRLDTILRSLGPIKLRSRLLRIESSTIVRIFKVISHTFREVGYTARFILVVPYPCKFILS